MSKAQIIRAMETAGLFVESHGSEVHGITDSGSHLYARSTGGDVWKLRTSKTANPGTLVRSEEEAERIAARLTRPALAPTSEVYHDGEFLFALEPATSAALVAA